MSFVVEVGDYLFIDRTNASHSWKEQKLPSIDIGQVVSVTSRIISINMVRQKKQGRGYFLSPDYLIKMGATVEVISEEIFNVMRDVLLLAE